MARQPRKNNTKTTTQGETKSDKFIRLGSARVGKAIKALEQVQALANKNNYEFTAEQVKQIKTALNAANKSVSDAFDAALEGKAAKRNSGFTFISEQE